MGASVVISGTWYNTYPGDRFTFSMLLNHRNEC